MTSPDLTQNNIEDVVKSLGIHDLRMALTVYDFYLSKNVEPDIALQCTRQALIDIISDDKSSSLS